MTAQVSGLANLYNIMQEQTAKDEHIAKQIFLAVTKESITQEELLELVSPEVMLQFIFLCINLTKSSRAVVNQLKSKKDAANAKLRAQAYLHDWLDKNFYRYKGFLNNCADEALVNLPNLGRSWSWVRKEITAYAKSKK